MRHKSQTSHSRKKGLSACFNANQCCEISGLWHPNIWHWADYGKITPKVVPKVALIVTPKYSPKVPLIIPRRGFYLEKIVSLASLFFSFQKERKQREEEDKGKLNSAKMKANSIIITAQEMF